MEKGSQFDLFERCNADASNASRSGISAPSSPTGHGHTPVWTWTPWRYKGPFWSIQCPSIIVMSKTTKPNQTSYSCKNTHRMLRAKWINVLERLQWLVSHKKPIGILTLSIMISVYDYWLHINSGVWTCMLCQPMHCSFYSYSFYPQRTVRNATINRFWPPFTV